MISADTRAKYTATIGIECHVQLKTKTKLFAAVGNDAREAPPNTLVSHICFGLPGALPVLNKEAVHLATRAAFALGTEPQNVQQIRPQALFLSRPAMGYQITQYDEPIIGRRLGHHRSRRRSQDSRHYPRPPGSRRRQEHPPGRQRL